MNKIFDINKQWSFIYPDLIPVIMDINPILNSEGKIEFSIPYGINGINFTFDSYNKKMKEIRATYYIADTANKGNIVFKITEKGKILQGTPDTFHGTKKWKIVQK